VVGRVVKIEILSLFIAIEGRSRTVRVGWSVVVVWIQCFDFSSRGETMG
jgi:hypothetical protein